MRIIYSCDVHVCLTWEAEKENITFKCKVSQLQWRVYFLNPKNKEQGHCLSPIPFSKCFSSSHNFISQDRRTNTTLLVIHRHVDDNFSGPWKCLHGTKRDEAIINVTVIHKVKIKTGSNNVIYSCDVHVCLTWEAEKENITFKCKVSQLQWRVYFLNPKNKEQGHCLSPIPFSKCFSSSHNFISQDRRTNTTLLVIHRHVDDNFSGPWKCLHGTKRDEAIINVTVIHKVKIKTGSNNDNCYEEYMAWTFISIVICLGLFLVPTCLRTIVCIFQDKNHSDGKICTRVDVCRRYCMIPSKLHDIVKLCTGIILISVVILVPLTSGKRASNCKDKHYFSLFGCFVVAVFVICRSISRKDGPSPRCQTDANEDHESVVIELQGVLGEGIDSEISSLEAMAE